MSSYFNGLDPIARGRYEEKLQLLGLSTLEDPYELRKTDKFSDSMALWQPHFLLLRGATCPYSVRHTKPNKALYLLPAEGGYKLSRIHDYYYQIQGQLGILQRPVCDFVCWTPHGIHIERITYDPSFFADICVKLQHFFVHIILPRMLCGTEKENTCHPSEAAGIFCFCRKGEVGKMVLCDNPSCKYGWFHFSCVNLKSTPEGAWFCPDCKC